jgi:hypothetical protein
MLNTHNMWPENKWHFWLSQVLLILFYVNYCPNPLPSQYSFIHFISHSVNPLHGVNHKDVESVIEYNDIYNIQWYSWKMYKSKDLQVWTISTLQINNILSIIIYYYIFAVSKINNSIIIPNVKDKKLLLSTSIIIKKI